MKNTVRVTQISNNQLAKEPGLQTSSSEEVRGTNLESRGLFSNIGVFFWLHSQHSGECCGILSSSTPSVHLNTLANDGPVDLTKEVVAQNGNQTGTSEFFPVQRPPINTKIQRKLLAMSDDYQQGDNVFFRNILLKIVDDCNIDEGQIPEKLLKEPKVISFLEFVANGVMKKGVIIAHTDGQDLVMWLNANLSLERQQKRTDQKLRWVFNTVLKLLSEEMSDPSNNKQSYTDKFDLYLSKTIRSPADRQKLKQDIGDCKISSIKRFHEFFLRHQTLRTDFERVLTNPSFFSDLLGKRIRKTMEIIQAFDDWYNLKIKLNVNTLASEIPHRFPWSVAEMQDSISLVKSILVGPSKSFKDSINQNSQQQQIELNDDLAKPGIGSRIELVQEVLEATSTAQSEKAIGNPNGFTLHSSRNENEIHNMPTDFKPSGLLHVAKLRESIWGPYAPSK